ncbi:hypothetical protein A3C18_01235 [Candidatus Kaiserbacteria bacterium RIFCSPHIGHO2_02_FULL_54_11b]|uniref:Uncharacterized protein n=2 Tax=Candidatus Kaiseribacteriota TaxID=1752734 RepID=A0A1F6CJH6_9BACT|nr:MAG: hypothetical protein A2704_04475 [Candidatus Kaiserbacteria bacterium RIFCSPHIGHO2_01_FULL_54_36b]OGG64833.1 MAG: hypothetical protein A3C18_01235 [Candidatus Kaiserbacteria bacterium RIFCSPHIGHO2_02_FULL_54_11b]
MFKNLANFSYKRSVKEAIGFYIAWFAVLLLVSIVASLVASSLTQTDASTFEEGYALGVKIGAVIAFFSSTFLAVMIAKDKKILSNFGPILLVLLTALLAALGGGLLGLIIPAYLSTRDAQISSPNLSNS